MSHLPDHNVHPRLTARRLALALALLVAAIVLYIWTAPRTDRDPQAPVPPAPSPAAATPRPAQLPDTPGAPAAEQSPARSEKAASAPSAATAPAVASPSVPAHDPEQQAPAQDAAGSAALPGQVQEDLERVAMLVQDFRSAHGENPVGTNAEITTALRGDNPKQVRLELPPAATLNEEGELLDRWGTPYFFHQLSGKQMEIRSAGVDRKMWTEDDQQVK